MLDRDHGNLTDPDRSLSLEQQAQYQAFLQEIWVTTQPQCLDSLAALADTIVRLLLGTCTYVEQEQAYQQAHKLVGTLGMFGLMSAMEMVREVECALAGSTLLTQTEASRLPHLIDESILAIEDFEIEDFEIAGEDSPNPAQSLQIFPAFSLDLPSLLFVDLEPVLAQSLSDLAETCGISTLAFVDIDTVVSYLTTMDDPPIDISPPTVILVSLSSDRTPQTIPSSLLEFITDISQRFPHWSVLVLGERDGLTDRLAVVRNGGKFIGTVGLTPEQIFTAATSLIQSINLAIKVMIVDDDLVWLRALPQLLQPWGLNITTLADPQEFWTVLQSAQPDVLILDLRMPEINGLELCQVLRSDPNWEHLPILFLSATNDPIAQQDAFSVGADDYLCKPIVAGELAWRIRHRLARAQRR